MPTPCPICHSTNTIVANTIIDMSDSQSGLDPDPADEQLDMLNCANCHASVPMDRVNRDRIAFVLAAQVLWPSPRVSDQAGAFGRAKWALHGINLFTTDPDIKADAALLCDIAEQRQYGE